MWRLRLRRPAPHPNPRGSGGPGPGFARAAAATRPCPSPDTVTEAPADSQAPTHRTWEFPGIQLGWKATSLGEDSAGLLLHKLQSHSFFHIRKNKQLILPVVKWCAYALWLFLLLIAQFFLHLALMSLKR